MSTDNLMLVSVLGLVVNIFGLLAFHEAHNHGLGGGDCALHDHSNDPDGCCGEDHGGASIMALSPQGDLVVRAYQGARVPALGGSEGVADGAEFGATEGDALGACDGDMLGATESDSLGVAAFRRRWLRRRGR
jgi:Co/Zn/Cd efflux system component